MTSLFAKGAETASGVTAKLLGALLPSASWRYQEAVVPGPFYRGENRGSGTCVPWPGSPSWKVSSFRGAGVAGSCTVTNQGTEWVPGRGWLQTQGLIKVGREQGLQEKPEA